MHPDPRRHIPLNERITPRSSYYRGDKLHRDVGPAFIGWDGTEAWYRDGKLHREDGPAVEWGTGLKEWYMDGKRHRQDGPAVEWRDGYREWWWRGEQYTERAFAEQVLKSLAEDVSGRSVTAKPLKKIKPIGFG